jgi:ribonuclease PH
MSEGNGLSTEELAYLLWEKQGRHEDRSEQNWIEAEYLARSLATANRDEAEADLRMRGLGSLTQGESLPPSGDAQQSENGSGTSQIDQSERDAGGTSVIASCVAGAALVIAVGVLISFFRKMG